MTSENRAAEPPGGGKLKGHHVLFMLVAFFGIVFTVNGVFLGKALSTYTGVVSVEPYVKGLAYNTRIAAGNRQAALGWTDSLEVGRDGNIAITIANRDGQPVRGLALTGMLGRPSTNRLDRALTLVEAEPGRYAAVTGKVLEEGTWLVAVEARASEEGGEPVYRLRRRIWVKL
jgi:nitrogen fixation protein FixH